MNYDKYGKLVNGSLVRQSQKELYYEGKVYIPAPDDIMEKAGYMLILETPEPASEWGNTCTWEIEKDTYIVQHWIPNPDPRTPAEKRRDTYESRKCVSWTDEQLTVNEANWVVLEYECENRDMTELKEIIAEAKNGIRSEFPDETSVETKTVKKTSKKK